MKALSLRTLSVAACMGFIFFGNICFADLRIKGAGAVKCDTIIKQGGDADLPVLFSSVEWTLGYLTAMGQSETNNPMYASNLHQISAASVAEAIKSMCQAQPLFLLQDVSQGIYHQLGGKAFK